MGKINPPGNTPKSIRSLLDRIEVRDMRIEELEIAISEALTRLQGERHAAQGEHPVAMLLAVALQGK